MLPNYLILYSPPPTSYILYSYIKRIPNTEGGKNKCNCFFPNHVSSPFESPLYSSTTRQPSFSHKTVTITEKLSFSRTPNERGEKGYGWILFLFHPHTKNCCVRRTRTLSFGFLSPLRKALILILFDLIWSFLLLCFVWNACHPSLCLAFLKELYYIVYTYTYK